MGKRFSIWSVFPGVNTRRNSPLFEQTLHLFLNLPTCSLKERSIYISFVHSLLASGSGPGSFPSSMTGSSRAHMTCIHAHEEPQHMDPPWAQFFTKGFLQQPPERGSFSLLAVVTAFWYKMTFSTTSFSGKKKCAVRCNTHCQFSEIRANTPLFLWSTQQTREQQGIGPF